MDKEKYVGTSKRKSLDDTLDDSFDFFLPNKLKEKSVLGYFNVKSGTICSNNSRRKKSSPPSSSSSLSQETVDTDMDNVMAVCLLKDDNNSFSKVSNVRNRENDGTSWRDITRKMKRQPLLMKRTPAEREAILSQKLAVILVDDNGDDDKSNKQFFTSVNLDDLIQSEFLLQQWCKTSRLWSAAQRPPLKINEFYITVFSNYLEVNETSVEEECANQTRLTFDLEKCEELNKPKLIEFPGFSSSKDFSELQLQEQNREDDKSSLDIFENYQMEESSYNVHSPDKTNQIALDHLEEDEHQVKECSNNAALSSNAELAPLEVIAISSSPSSENTAHLPIKSDYDSQQTISLPDSLSSILTEQGDKNIGMLDRVGVALLADQWDNLFSANEGDIMVVLDNEESLNVHKLVLATRCQALIYEINDDNKLIWNMYSLQVARAFFRYIYSGKFDHLWHLNTLEKSTVKRLARLYELSHLEEVLIKFHGFSGPSMVIESNTLQRPSTATMESCKTLSSSVQNESFKEKSWKMPSPSCSATLRLKSPENLASEIHSNSSPDGEEMQSSFKENNYTIRDTGGSLGISPSPGEDIYQYDYIFRSPSSTDQDDPSTKSPRPRPLKKSLEAYFQDSFPELPSEVSTSSITFPRQSEDNITDHIMENTNDTLSSASQEEDSDDENSFNQSLISTSFSESPKKSPSNSITDRLCLPSSAVLSPARESVTLQHHTPNTTNSEIFFSKNATPFPNYNDMITPQLKKELKRFGLKGNLGSVKAKLLLKYIYDQTHPVVESSEEPSEREGTSSQPLTSSDSSKLY